MGSVRLNYGGDEEIFFLARSSLVGRHPNCHIVINHPDVPLYWLELRWTSGHWAWRPFHDESSRTRGTGRHLSKGWRVFGDGRIRCGQNVILSAHSSDPPQIFAVDLQSGEHHMAEHLDSVVEVWGNQVRRIDWETDSEPAVISDCSIQVFGDRAYRFHIPQHLSTTQGASVAVDSEMCQLDIFTDTLRAVFTVGHHSCTAEGECVRVLWAYCLARLDDVIPEGGWLTRVEAHEGWLKLGGHESSTNERIGWEKGKLRSRLSQNGASGLDSLFQNRKQGGLLVSRIHLIPEQICIHP